MKNIELLAILAFALFLVACGGGSKDVNSMESRSLLPAPILYALHDSTLVIIDEQDLGCDINLYIKESTLEKIVYLGKLREFLNSSVDPSILYQYSCDKLDIQSSRSRTSHLPLLSYLNVNSSSEVLSIEDFDNNNVYEVLGSLGESGKLPNLSFELSGLGNLLTPCGAGRLGCRIGRDIRFADFDNDGILDAIANVYSDDSADSFIKLLWGKGSGQFEMDNTFSIPGYRGYGETVVVADLDNDGFLDIIIPQYKKTGSANLFSRNLLFRNNRNRTFTEMAIAANIVNTLENYPEGAQAVDFNEDGLIDLYLGGSLLINRGNFVFEDVTRSIGLPGSHDEGIKFFDYNLDGHFDLLIHDASEKPRLFINKNGKFAETASDVFPNEYFDSSYGVNVGDFNGDGYDDVLLGGGFGAEDLSGISIYSAPRLYLNLNGKFVRQDLISEGLGWSDLVSFGDMNNDGALDIIVRYGGIKLILNDNIPNRYVKLTVLSGGIKNQHGRTVKAKWPDGRIKALVIDGGSGYLSNQPYTLLIPNDKNENIVFDIYCSRKIITLSAKEGEYVRDCLN